MVREELLSDTAVVVRCASDLVKNAERTRVATGRYGLSAWAAEAPDAAELVWHVPTLVFAIH